MLKVNATLHTCGDGYWSSKARAVRIKELRVPYIDEIDMDFGELRVYFDRNDWDVNSDGLIYTDSLFKKELKEFLTSIGIDASDVSYSEQGMQGDYYVSLDVGGKFLASWTAKTAVEA
jgi:hypothetical protein